LQPLAATSSWISSAQERVGINSAVNPEATGALPGATARRLVIGQDVIFNEHITTSGSGQTQLLFLDESSMSIGPNSQKAREMRRLVHDGIDPLTRRRGQKTPARSG